MANHTKSTASYSWKCAQLHWCMQRHSRSLAHLPWRALGLTMGYFPLAPGLTISSDSVPDTRSLLTVFDIASKCKLL